MTDTNGSGHVMRFDHDLRRMVEAPIVHEVTARRSPVVAKVEVKLEAGGARHYTWIDPAEARILAAQLLAAAADLGGHSGAK